ncbi:hypothetical protein BFJ68_g16896 [Fusarium oxysporum]|uniref:Uncharacterized protein n=1 Tax=Fusarium oxysporum TaxID=5507 RepID=A0A420P812_FUSOX|nr:hypothetical protein BFJ68_g16896 [Fusarium oxysporum]
MTSALPSTRDLSLIHDATTTPGNETYAKTECEGYRSGGNCC